MLSHRYGSRFLLEEIPQREFEMILNQFKKVDFKELGISNDEMISLLNRCYELDENDLFEKKYKIRKNDVILHGLGVLLSRSLIIIKC
jgi:hypothetical protein